MPTPKELWRALLNKFAPTIREKPYTNVAKASAARQQAEHKRDEANARNAEVAHAVNWHRQYGEDVFAEKFRLALRGEGKREH